MVKALAAIAETLPSERQDFVTNMAGYLDVGRRVSPKQADYLKDLYEKYIYA